MFSQDLRDVRRPYTAEGPATATASCPELNIDPQQGHPVDPNVEILRIHHNSWDG